MNRSEHKTGGPETAIPPPAGLDHRDRYLGRHMRQRMALAASLPLEKRRSWATKCIAIARTQHRSAFYLMACVWLTNNQCPGL